MTRLGKGAAGLAAAIAISLGYCGSVYAQGGPLLLAQSYDAPPADVGGGGDEGYGAPQGGGVGGGTDSASLLVRVERLEDQIRQMTGQLQQMQYQNQQLQDQLKKFEQDVDFRFQERQHGTHLPRHSELNTNPGAGAANMASTDTSPDSASADSTNTDSGIDSGADTSVADDDQGRRKHDAFDPAEHPDAPGAPHPLGSPESAPPPPVADNTGTVDPNAPLNLPSSQYNSVPTAAPATPARNNVAAGNNLRPTGTVLASAEVNSPRQQFDIALAYFKQKNYDDAQRSFSAFLDKNPKSRLTAEALYLLGESYSARGRTREAAEQFLKISTNYTNSSRAPEAMLRLGESLRILGAKEQACATFSEVPRKYPHASAAVKAGAEREAKRSQCGA